MSTLKYITIYFSKFSECFFHLRYFYESAYAADITAAQFYWFNHDRKLHQIYLECISSVAEPVAGLHSCLQCLTVGVGVIANGYGMNMCTCTDIMCVCIWQEKPDF